MYNQHTTGMETTRHRSLGERGRRKAFRDLAQTKKKIVRKPRYSQISTKDSGT